MLAFVSSITRFGYSRLVGLAAVRYASSKKKIAPTTSSSAPAIRHNWLDMVSEVNVSLLPSTPDSAFTTRIIQSLSESGKTPLSASVTQKMLKEFQSWSPHEFYDLVSTLGSYGLQPVDVLRLLINVPSADRTILNRESIQKCCENLLQLKFDTTTRSILLSNDPNLIQYDFDYLRERADVLLCHFTAREISKLIRNHPSLFTESWKDLDYKINYLKIMLFASTRDIVECGALAYSLDHIRSRFLFVHRAGLFKRVRREEQYVAQRELNIRLTDIFDTSISTFLKRTTNNLLRADDYQAFVDSLGMETFDNEFDKYLSLKNDRKKWSQAAMAAQRHERRNWMFEFDMYDNDDEEMDDETSIETISDASLAVIDREQSSHLSELTFKTMMEDSRESEPKPSSWHPLSDFAPDRHRRRKLQLNQDPDTRL